MFGHRSHDELWLTRRLEILLDCSSILYIEKLGHDEPGCPECLRKMDDQDWIKIQPGETTILLSVCPSVFTVSLVPIRKIGLST